MASGKSELGDRETKPQTRRGRDRQKDELADKPNLK